VGLSLKLSTGIKERASLHIISAYRGRCAYAARLCSITHMHTHTLTFAGHPLLTLPLAHIPHLCRLVVSICVYVCEFLDVSASYGYLCNVVRSFEHVHTYVCRVAGCSALCVCMKIACNYLQCAHTWQRLRGSDSMPGNFCTLRALRYTIFMFAISTGGILNGFAVCVICSIVCNFCWTLCTGCEPSTTSA